MCPAAAALAAAAAGTPSGARDCVQQHSPGRTRAAVNDTLPCTLTLRRLLLPSCKPNDILARCTPACHAAACCLRCSVPLQSCDESRSAPAAAATPDSWPRLAPRTAASRRLCAVAVYDTQGSRIVAAHCQQRRKHYQVRRKNRDFRVIARALLGMRAVRHRITNHGNPHACHGPLTRPELHVTAWRSGVICFSTSLAKQAVLRPEQLLTLTTRCRNQRIAHS
jgi:hypothetical protein